MLFTGFNYRRFCDSLSGTFVFQDFYFDANETIGQAAPYISFGLTGYNDTLIGEKGAKISFTCVSGRVYDDYGRFISSYGLDSPITISGNFYSTGGLIKNPYYTYYLNGDLISDRSSMGAMTDAAGWFVSCANGASAQGDVSFYGPAIPCTLTYDTTFPIGGIWNCVFKHQSSAPLGVVIRSGKISDDTAGFSFSGTGLSYNSGTNILLAGAELNIGLQHIENATVTGGYSARFTIYTDFGSSYFSIQGNSILPYNYIVVNDFSPQTGYTFSTPGEDYTWNFSSSRYATDGAEMSNSLYGELAYDSGYTGTLYYVSGVQITNGGAGYFTAPMVRVLPLASGIPAAYGVGVLNGGAISDVSWSTNGVYKNTGLCAVSFMGGTGESATVAEGIPLFGTYAKSFDQIFQFYTGSFISESGTLATYSSPKWSGGVVLPSGQTVLSLNVYYSGSRDNLPLQYVIKGSGLPDTYTNQSTFSYTGQSVYNPLGVISFYPPEISGTSNLGDWSNLDALRLFNPVEITSLTIPVQNSPITAPPNLSVFPELTGFYATGIDFYGCSLDFSNCMALRSLWLQECANVYDVSFANCISLKDVNLTNVAGPPTETIDNLLSQLRTYALYNKGTFSAQGLTAYPTSGDNNVDRLVLIEAGHDWTIAVNVDPN